MTFIVSKLLCGYIMQFVVIMLYNFTVHIHTADVATFKLTLQCMVWNILNVMSKFATSVY